MIRRPDDFPDVDRAIEEAARRPAVLDYRGRRADEDLKDVPVGRYVRRIAFAFGLAALCGGLGASINSGGDGSAWMAIGGFTLGLTVPFPGTKPE